MKKIILYLFACMALAVYPTQSYCSSTVNPAPVEAPSPEESARANTIMLRLNEINALDKSDLKSSEKKSLRKEVRSIKKELKEINNGVYISVGGLLLIIILLIILF